MHFCFWAKCFSPKCGLRPQQPHHLSQLAMETPGSHPRPLFGADGDLQPWQCRVTNSHLSHEGLWRGLVPYLPRSLTTGQAAAPLPQLSLKARSRSSFPCGCVCCLSQPATSSSGFPCSTSQLTKSPIKALPCGRARVCSVHSFPRPLPLASWINSDNLSHPYRHTSKCGPMRTGKGQDRKEEGTNQRTTPSALRGQTLFPLASRMQHLRLFSLLCVLSSPSLFKQTHFKCQWVTMGPSQPGGDQIAKGSDLCSKVASRETRDPAPCREWRIHEWLKWAFVVLTRAP